MKAQLFQGCVFISSLVSIGLIITSILMPVWDKFCDPGATMKFTQKTNSFQSVGEICVEFSLLRLNLTLPRIKSRVFDVSPKDWSFPQKVTFSLLTTSAFLLFVASIFIVTEIILHKKRSSILIRLSVTQIVLLFLAGFIALGGMVVYLINQNIPTNLFIKSVEITPESYADLFGVTDDEEPLDCPIAELLKLNGNFDADYKQFLIYKKYFNSRNARLFTTKTVSHGIGVATGWASVAMSFTTAFLSLVLFITFHTKPKYRKNYNVSDLY